MAAIFNAGNSLTQARHYYVHFLIRNFTDLRIPRWYEEGLAAYLSNFSVNRNSVELNPYSQRAFEGSLRVNLEVTLDELLFEEDALGSPRLIQRANLKSEVFLNFLLPGHSEPGFEDRRDELQSYIGLSLAGRTQRYTFDQSFNVTLEQLDAEYERYLMERSRPRGDLDLTGLDQIDVQDQFENTVIEFEKLAIALGKLSINSGKFCLAKTFFEAARSQESSLPRTYSGLADSLRMQERDDVTDTDLTALYQQALSHCSQTPSILLDYGEYLKTVLNDCDLNLNEEQQSTTQN